MDTIQVIIMGEAEARMLVQKIRDNLNSLADDLWELKNREGWKALGYNSWRDCAMAEFDLSQSRVYQLLTHAQITRNIASDSTMVEKPTSERQTRPLQELPPTEQPVAWASAVREAQGQPSAKQVERIVKEIKPITKESQTKWNPKPKVSIGGFNQTVRGDDISQVTPDDDINQTGMTTIVKRVNGFTKEQVIDMLSQFDNEAETCPYCEKSF